MIKTFKTEDKISYVIKKSSQNNCYFCIKINNNLQVFLIFLRNFSTVSYRAVSYKKTYLCTVLLRSNARGVYKNEVILLQGVHTTGKQYTFSPYGLEKEGNC